MNSAWERGGVEADPIINALRMLRRRWKPFVLTVIVCAAAVAGLQSRQEKEFEATAQVLFGEATLSAVGLGVERGSSDPERDAGTQVLLATSREVATRANDQLGKERSTSSLLKRLEVQTEENANVLSLTARSTDPAEARAIANAFAESYIEFKRESDTASIRESRRALEAQRAELDADSPQRPEIVQQIANLSRLEAIAGGDARIIGRAGTPTEPATMSVKRAGILGVIAGIALGLMMVFLVESLDRRMTSIEDFEREYRARVLTVVPEKVFRIRAGASHVQELEPFRILRSALDVSRVASAGSVIMVTSAKPGEGKTTVAVDLAHAIALAGRPVTVVELDLRRPTFSRHFELEGRTGVTTALVGRTGVAGLLQFPIPQLPALSVLPAGPLPPNPSELLESGALDALLDELRSDGRTLVLDTPPLIPVADSQVMLRHRLVDTGLVVARFGVTTRDEARRARAILDGLAFEPLGIVLTGHDDHEGYYGTDGYHMTDPVADLKVARTKRT